MTPDLIYFEGQWFDNNEAMQEHLEKRFSERSNEGVDCDQDWMLER